MEGARRPVGLGDGRERARAGVPAARPRIVDAMPRHPKAPRARVVLINGPPGAGKTVVGRRLAATARNGVCIDGDGLRRFVVSRREGEVEAGVGFLGAAALADTFLAAGYELVVVDLRFARGEQVKRFHRALRSQAPVHLLTLWAPLRTLAARDSRRADAARVGERRLAAAWNELAAHLGELGVLVDASGAPDLVVTEARQALRDPASLLGPLRAPARRAA